MLDTICDVFKEAYRRGWVTTRDGNASMKRPDADYFYITPSGVRKQSLVPDMFIKMDIGFDGTSRDKWMNAGTGMLKEQLNKGLKPSGELHMHWLLQRRNPTDHTRVVLHLHPTYTIAAATAGFSLQDIAQSYPEIFRYTRVGNTIGYIEPISEALGQAVNDSMIKDSATGETSCDVVALSAHGAVSIGSDPWEAFEHIERLEHICQIFMIQKAAR